MRVMLRRAFLILVLPLLASCGRSTPPPASPGTLRIAALSPAVAIIVRDLGHEREIVARHAFDMVLTPAIPVAGDQADLNYEALLSVAPTHVITQWGSRQLPDHLTSLASEYGWKLHETTLLTVADLRREVRDIDAALNPNASEPSRECAALLRRLDEVLRPRDSAPRAGRVLLLAGIDPPGALGPGSWHHEVLVSIGAAPAFDEGSPWITLDHERLTTLAPDAIVLLKPRTPGTPPPRGGVEAPLVGADVSGHLGRLGLLDLPAIRNSRLAMIDDPLALTPGTNLIALAEQLGAVLDAWASDRRNEKPGAQGAGLE